MKNDLVDNQQCEWNKEEVFSNNEFQHHSIYYTGFRYNYTM